MKYMKQLDSLRAFAALAVVFHHFFWNRVPLPYFEKIINWGHLGVDFFFVLSGFLITGILVESKIKIESKDLSVSSVLKNFYFRRSLRIFPVYYFTIAFAFLLNLEPVRQTLLWHLTYISNLYFALRGDWHGRISHLWSLSVEEQFYLLWPFLVLLIARKYLFKVFLGVIFLTIVFRLLCYKYCFATNEIVSMTIMLGNMDLFAIGSILAIRKKINIPDIIITKQKKVLQILTGIIFFAMFLAHQLGYIGYFMAFYRTVEALCFCFIINKASIGFSGIVGKILENKILVFIGKISYALYLFHQFVPRTYIEGHVYLSFAIHLSVTIFAATVSLYILEQPLNRLKERIIFRDKCSIHTKTLVATN